MGYIAFTAVKTVQYKALGGPIYNSP